MPAIAIDATPNFLRRKIGTIGEIGRRPCLIGHQRVAKTVSNKAYCLTPNPLMATKVRFHSFEWVANGLPAKCDIRLQSAMLQRPNNGTKSERCTDKSLLSNRDNDKNIVPSTLAELLKKKKKRGQKSRY